MRITEADQARVRRVLPELDRLIAFGEENRESLAARTSPAELGRTLFFARIMRQWWTGGAGSRSRHMGENLLLPIDRDRPDASVVYWGHNYHVGAETFSDKGSTAGHVLRQRCEDSYYSCALECGEGSYQTREVRPDAFMEDLRVHSIGPVQRRSFPSYLARAGFDRYFVDFRSRPREQAIEEWLDRSLMKHCGTGWAHGGEAGSSCEPVAVSQQNDGAIFVDQSTSTSLTAAADDLIARLGAL